MITTKEEKYEIINESLKGPSEMDETIESYTCNKNLLKIVRYRWIALFFICNLVCGSYFCYDNPATLQAAIIRRFDVSVTQYSLLYSVYSLPNIILPIFGGKIIDKFGKGSCLILTTLLVFLGQFILSFGADWDSFWTLVLGRLIFGMGSETLFVVQAVYCNNWFKNMEISLAMGVSSSVPNFISFMSGFVVPRVY
jgi:MFS family permease